ncbi:anti-sigma factor [Mycobacterium sp. MYCO198283]|uniref:anti-sigma factor n=1 Tax=Mycobacterium sp. MYCO198283 TaxID=2883505 RepID=UPI001E4D6684|nr:anti-sigma factor [Mycobacterium sp. MYCO198283]MCG5431054.1 anti-sigma factor [Mycobacterium sp. MYCO198283]
MTAPHDSAFLDMATAYALNAVTDIERADIERRLRVAPPDVAAEFAAEVRAVRETMAAMSAATAVEPPPALRSQILASATQQRRSRSRRRRTAVVAAAAAVVIGLAAVGVGLAFRSTDSRDAVSTDTIFAAPDVRTVTGDLPTGGTATFIYSRDRHAGVLVMNNVAPPQPGTVYQMWLMSDAGAESAGTMDDEAVSPSTTAVLPQIGDSTALAFTVEPGDGSPRPTGPLVAQLPLS